MGTLTALPVGAILRPGDRCSERVEMTTRRPTPQRNSFVHCVAVRPLRIPVLLGSVLLLACGLLNAEAALDDLEAARGQLRVKLEQIMGAYPSDRPRAQLDVQVESVEDVGEFERRRLTYLSEPGSRVPAYLLVPKAALK